MTSTTVRAASVRPTVRTGRGQADLLDEERSAPELGAIAALAEAMLVVVGEPARPSRAHRVNEDPVGDVRGFHTRHRGGRPDSVDALDRAALPGRDAGACGARRRGDR